MKTIFYDVDTQNDFVNANGALYVPDAELIKPTLAKLTKYACKQGIPIFGSVDRHFGTPEYKEREGELQVNGGKFPLHCMDGTDGQKKIVETVFVYDAKEIHDYFVETAFIDNPLKNRKAVLLQRHTIGAELTSGTLEREIKKFLKDNKYITRDKTDDPSDVTAGIFFEKQNYDVATNPWFEKVIKAVAPERAIVYGVATEYCVSAGALALRKAGVPEVYLVTDAIKGINPEECKKALEEMVEAGVKLTSSKEVLEGKLK